MIKTSSNWFCCYGQPTATRTFMFFFVPRCLCVCSTQVILCVVHIQQYVCVYVLTCTEMDCFVSTEQPILLAVHTTEFGIYAHFNFGANRRRTNREKKFYQIRFDRYLLIYFIVESTQFTLHAKWFYRYHLCCRRWKYFCQHKQVADKPEHI